MVKQTGNNLLVIVDGLFGWFLTIFLDQMFKWKAKCKRVDLRAGFDIVPKNMRRLVVITSKMEVTFV